MLSVKNFLKIKLVLFSFNNILLFNFNVKFYNLAYYCSVNVNY